MAKQLKNRGPGRPPKEGDERMIQTAVRLTPAHFEWLKEVSARLGDVGMNAALRVIIARDKKANS